MRKLFFLSIVLLVGLGTPSDAPSSQLQSQSYSRTVAASWTVMVYLDGDNNLEGAGIDDFLEMAAVGSNTSVNIVVQFDRIDGYDDTYGDWTGTKRFLVTPGMTPTAANALSDLGELNMGSPVTLVNFVDWAKSTYPATNYALVLWNHGGGWRQGKEDLWRDKDKKKPAVFKAVCWDDTNGGDCLYTAEVESALNSTGGAQLIGFDACLMSMMEVAFQVKDYGQVMVGSEETEPGDGWPYNTILGDLKANPSMTPLALGSIIVDRYYQSYGSSETQAAIDLGRLNTLAGTISTFAQAMIDSWDSDEAAVRTAAQAVMTEIDTAVINEKHGTDWPGAHGLAIYFPDNSGDFDTDYNGTIIDFPAQTVWEEFLQEYYASMGSSWIAQRRAASQQFTYPENIDLYHFCELINLVQDNYYTESPVTNSFTGGGTGLGFHGDDNFITYYLPFAFTFFDETFPAGSPIYIASNGYVDFSSGSPHNDYSNTLSELANNKRIAPCWADLKTDGSAQTGEDVYITENTGNVIIRWVAETFGEEVPLNFELQLFSDGRIQFNYGSGNNDISPWDTPPTIGISRGDGLNYYLSAFNGQTNLTNVDSALFTPYNQPAITVTRPVGSETYAVSNQIPIEWTTANITGTVRISLWKSDNSSGYLVDAAAAYDASPYNYTIPSSIPVGTYYIRVKQDTVSGKSGIFTINAPQKITVTAPTAGTFFTGKPLTIGWTTTGITSGTVRIVLKKSDNSAVYELDPAAPYNGSPRTYIIPCHVPASTYYIRVVQGTVAGKSTNFTVSSTSPCFSVTVPRGGETFVAGSPMTIKWVSAGITGDLRINLRKTDGSVVYLVVGSVPYTGTPYYYTIPATITDGTYHIRIKQGTTILGDSQPFTITH